MQKEYHIPEPPKWVFENFRTETSVMLEENSPVQEVEMYDLTEGMQIYYKGVKHPVKGFPYAPAIYNTNIAKRVFLIMLNPFMLIGWRKNKERFERCVDWVMQNYYLLPQFQTPVCREICKLPLGKTAKIIGHIFEWDDAYRYMLQDIMTELKEEELRKNPYKEVKRLYIILGERVSNFTMHHKYKQLKFFIFLLIPFKRKFLNFIKDVDFDNLRFDEHDRYWVSVRVGYNFFGKTPEENWESVDEHPVSYLIKEKVV